ncbi:MAG: hypothetical protein RLZZ238_1335, partial [Planctomycetota bacterium]
FPYTTLFRSGGRRIFETIATQGKGVVELLEGLFS